MFSGPDTTSLQDSAVSYSPSNRLANLDCDAAACTLRHFQAGELETEILPSLTSLLQLFLLFSITLSACKPSFTAVRRAVKAWTLMYSPCVYWTLTREEMSSDFPEPSHSSIQEQFAVPAFTWLLTLVILPHGLPTFSRDSSSAHWWNIPLPKNPSIKGKSPMRQLKEPHTWTEIINQQEGTGITTEA